VKNILLVGAGQLGSRHLQSLAVSRECFNFSIVDPSEESLNITKARFEEVEGHKNHKLSLFKCLYEVGNDCCDLVIVATNSGVRFEVLKKALTSFKIQNMILEKVLFPRLDEYERAKSLINEKCVNVWVNTPRRFYEINKFLKQNFEWKEIKAKYENKSWGIGCNSIHFIDLIQYLTGSELKEVNTNKLCRRIFESKRSGYIEFEGILECKFKDGSILELNSSPELKTGMMRIETKDFVFVINDSVGTCEILDFRGKQVEVKSFNNPYQSQLTLPIFNAILEGKKPLPTYNESMKEHLVFLKSLQNFMSEVNGKHVEEINVT